MSGKQSAVLWMGILLIAAQFYFGGQFKSLFGMISKTTAGPSVKSPGSGGGGTVRPVNKRTG